MPESGLFTPVAPSPTSLVPQRASPVVFRPQHSDSPRSLQGEAKLRKVKSVQEFHTHAHHSPVPFTQKRMYLSADNLSDLNTDVSPTGLRKYGLAATHLEKSGTQASCCTTVNNVMPGISPRFEQISMKDAAFTRSSDSEMYGSSSQSKPQVKFY